MCPRSHKECKTGIWGRFGWSPCPVGAQKHLLSSSLSASQHSGASPWSLWTLLPKSAAGWGSSGFSPSWGRCLCDLVFVSHHFFQIPLEENQAPFSSRQKKKKKVRAKNSEGTKECTVERQFFSHTQAVLTDFSGLLPGKYQEYMCVPMCVIFFFPSTQVVPSMVRWFPLQTLEAESLSINLNSVIPKPCRFGQVISPPCVWVCQSVKWDRNSNYLMDLSES